MNHPIKRVKRQSREDGQNLPFKQQKFHALHAWDVHYHAEHSIIKAYNEIIHDWEIIAFIKGNNHIFTAEFLASLANERNETPNLFEEAIKALELCLEDKALSWAAEQAADIVVRKAKQRFEQGNLLIWPPKPAANTGRAHQL